MANRDQELTGIIQSFQHISDPVIIADKEDRIISWNMATEIFYGIWEEEFLHLTLKDLVAVEEDAISYDEIRRVLHQAAYWHGEALHLTRDSGRKWVDWSINTLDLPLANFKGSLSVIKDITQYKQREQFQSKARQESEATYRALIENSLDIIMILNADGSIRYFSPSIKAFSGFEPAELIDKNVFSMLHPEDLSRVADVVVQGMQTPGAIVKFMVRVLNKDGTWRYVEASSKNFLEHPLIGGIVVNFRDITDRKRIEKSLQESEERYRHLAENARDMIWLTDIRGNILYVNQAVKQSLGYTPEEAIGLGVNKYLTKESINRISKWNRGALLANPPVNFYSGEVDYIHKDGSIVPCELNVSFIRNDEGKVIAVEGITRDITERKRVQEALRQSEERFRIASNIANDLLFEQDFQTRVFQFFNDVSIHLGYAPNELPRIFHDFWEWIHPDDLPLYIEAIRDNFNTGIPYRVEYRVCKKDGTYAIWQGSGTLVRDQAGNPLKWVGVATDIAKRKEAEEALRKSEETFRSLIENATDIITVVSPEGNIKYASPSIERAFGYKPEELIGHSGFEFIHPEDLPKALELFSNLARRPGNILETELRFLHKDGTFRYLEGVANNLLYDPSVNGIVMNTRDITARKRTEQEKAKLETQLNQAMKMEAIGRLAGGVAHDFNNILTGISGYTELLMSSISDGHPMFHDLDEIKKAAARAASLTGQLLAFSRKQIISPKVIDLNGLLNQSTNILRRLIREDIDFTFIPGANLGRVRADPGQIEQVLINLVVNARDAMPNGGRLTVATTNTEIDAAFCRDHAEVTPGAYVMLTISDNGCGMHKDVLNHLFEPFFTTKEKGKGTGLGLSMVYGIVKQNHGFVYVDSQVDVGTTFRIYLPLIHEEAEELRMDTAPPLPTGTETILLVEDEEMVRSLGRKVLEKQGYKVIVTSTGGDAFQVFQNAKEKIDLVLTDVIMPNMNGKQLFDQLRLLQPDLKVIFMSGYTEETIAHHGVLEEGTQFIHKPFTIEALARLVRKVLDN